VASLGTFWTAVSGTAATNALAAIRDIAVRASIFLGVQGLMGYTQGDATLGLITKLDSDASAGGAATETMVVTGLLTTDVILAVTPFQKAGTAASTPVIDYGDASGNCTVAGQLPVEFLGNPGVGAKLRVAVQRATAIGAGTYTVVAGALPIIPNLAFLSGDAPTAFKVLLSWELKSDQPYVEFES
jgi:hypothetical protein